MKETRRYLVRRGIIVIYTHTFWDGSHSGEYFWMNRSFINFDKGEDPDEWALANNYISVVPCAFDLTAHHSIPILNNEWDIQS